MPRIAAASIATFNKRSGGGDVLLCLQPTAPATRLEIPSIGQAVEAVCHVRLCRQFKVRVGGCRTTPAAINTPRSPGARAHGTIIAALQARV